MGEQPAARLRDTRADQSLHRIAVQRMTACAVGAQRPPGLRENVIRPVVAGMNEHSVAVGVPILQPLRLLPFAEDAAILGRDADIDKTVIESGTVEEAYEIGRASRRERGVQYV